MSESIEEEALNKLIETTIDEVWSMLTVKSQSVDGLAAKNYAHDGVVDVDDMIFTFNEDHILLFNAGVGALYLIDHDGVHADIVLLQPDEINDSMINIPLVRDISSLYFIKDIRIKLAKWLAEKSGLSEEEVIGWQP